MVFAKRLVSIRKFQLRHYMWTPKNSIIQGHETRAQKVDSYRRAETDLFRSGSCYYERGQVNAFERDDRA